MAFAQNLKHLMDIEGLSNYKLAKMLGCHQTTVQNWLDGSVPQKRTQNSIANVFGITVSELMGDDLPFPKNEKKPTREGELDDLAQSILLSLRALPIERQKEVESYIKYLAAKEM